MERPTLLLNLPNEDQLKSEWHPYCVWKNLIQDRLPAQVVNRNAAKRRFRLLTRVVRHN